MIYVSMYLIAIVAANLSVTFFGPGASIANSLIFIGLDLTSRDNLHDAWQGKNLWLKMFALVATGSLLSYVLNANSGHIALASFVSFAAAGLVDSFVYFILGKHSRLIKVNGSNVISAGVDSLIFPVMAFGFPIMWFIIGGQFIAKVTGGLIWSVILSGEKVVVE